MLLLPAVLVSAAPSARGQDAYFTFERFTQDQGTSSPDVNQVMVDRIGFLWCATARGLNKYDGTGFTVYQHEPDDSLSLAASWVDWVYEDRGGALWLKHFTEGLTRFDPDLGTARLFEHDPDDSTSLSAGPIRAIAEDERGRLWIAAGRDGLCRFEPDRGVFTHHRGGLAGPVVTHVAAGPGGRLWVATENAGLIAFDPDTGVGESVPPPGAARPILRLLRDGQGILRVATARGLFTLEGSASAGWRLTSAPPPFPEGRVTGILESRSAPGRFWVVVDERQVGSWDPRTAAWTPLDPGPDAVGDEGREIRSLHEDGDGNLWAGTNGGVYGLIRGEPAFRRFPMHVRGMGDRLLYPAVTSVCEDRSGLLWFGTPGAGLYKLNPRQLQFHHDFFSGPSLGEVDPFSVSAIHQDGAGRLWIGTVGAGLYRYDRATQETTSHRHQPGDPASLGSDRITALIPDRAHHGVLWVGTSRGVDRFDTRTGRARRYACGPGGASTPADHAVRALGQDRTGAVWIGLGRTGLGRLDPATGAMTRFPASTDAPAGIQDDQVLAILEDHAGRVWISSLPSGLHRFDRGTGTFERFTRGVDPRLPRSIQCMTEDRDRRLWLGTYSDGLVRFDPATGAVAQWSRSDGLPDNHILAIQEDASGRLWLGTENGLARFDPATEEVHVFGASHGVQSRRFLRNACARGLHGELFFGGMDGINAFYPERLRLNLHAPPVVITGITVRGGREGSRTLRGLRALDRLELGHRENFFTAEFAALDYTEPDRNRFAYRLDGQDASWIDNGTRRSATYTNLDPGSYTLRIRASNNDGVWNDSGIALPIVIHPPFWRTRAFAAGLGLAGAALVFGLYRNRLVAARAQARALERVRQAENERVRKQAARDFHDELGHLVTRISLFGEILSRRVPPTVDVGAYLDKIVATSKRLSQGMGDFIWVLDPEQDSLRELAVRIKDFGDHLFDGTGIAFRAPSLGEDLDRLPLTPAWRRHLMLIFQEAMHNALKHGQGRNVTLEVLAGAGGVTIILGDDGCGFDPAAVEAGRGLRSMKDRAGQIGGRLAVDSVPGRGTRVMFTGRPEEVRS